MAEPEKPIDHESLSAFLKALSYPTRLQILEALRLPRMVSEIRVAPQRIAVGDNPDRPASRQTLQVHLDQLVEAGLVLEVPYLQGERTLRRYVINPEKLYVISEELRRLFVHVAARTPSDGSTMPLDDTPAQDAASTRGPRFVLVHGVYVGKCYPLDPQRQEWTIGRSQDATLRVDHDPFVSGLNARVTRDGDGYRVADVDGSRNGTHVNWERLAKGATRALHPGDVVGIGRSLLVFASR